jgi:DNA polymerase-3 subunit beta
MKFKIEKGQLLKILQRSQGIVEKRNSMPILSNILIEAKGGKITATATDLEIFIKDSCPAKIDAEGAITINSRKFFEIVKELPEDEVGITASEGSKLTIKSGRSTFKLPGIPAGEFPAFPTLDESALKSIDPEVLREMIDRTVFATSTDETRYNINGVFFEKDNAKIRMVATDGHRLAMVEKTGKDGAALPGPNKGVILPKKGVIEVRRVLDEKEGAIELGFSDKNATVRRGSTNMVIRLIEGEFPDYKQVIPTNAQRVFFVNREDFLASLKRASILSSDKVKGVKFSLSRKKLVLTSSTPESGDATEEVDVRYEGDDMDIAFNARYFVEALGVLDDEDVKVELKEQLNPGLLKSGATEGFNYVVMPMRL